MTATFRRSVLRITTMSLITAAAGTMLSSCAYDPYRYGSNTSVSSSVGYGSNGHLSSSIFIRTSSSRWGYDPHCHSYYDFTRQCYYDPYLNGYYPRGYRPPIIVGVPHPHGWRPGVPTCPPPGHVRDYNLRDYRNRHQHYSNLNHSWARDLRTHTVSSQHHSNRSVGNWNGGNPYTNHPSSHSNPGWNPSNPGITQSRNSNWGQSNRPSHSTERNNHAVGGNSSNPHGKSTGNVMRNNPDPGRSNPGFGANRGPSTPNMTSPGAARPHPQSNPHIPQVNAAPRNIPSNSMSQASEQSHKGKIR